MLPGGPAVEVDGSRLDRGSGSKKATRPGSASYGSIGSRGPPRLLPICLVCKIKILLTRCIFISKSGAVASQLPVSHDNDVDPDILLEAILPSQFQPEMHLWSNQFRHGLSKFLSQEVRIRHFAPLRTKEDVLPNVQGVSSRIPFHGLKFVKHKHAAFV